MTADKNDGYMNGLTTLDIVMIQKHLLGIKKLESPYKILAADANFDAKVSASDLVELRNLILGKTDKLSNRAAWGFVNSDYTFTDQFNPWSASVDEMYHIMIDNLTSNQLENDFTALKIGDVNNSVVVGTSGMIVPRSSASLSYDDQVLESGKEFEIPFYISDIDNFEGIQFSLNVNPEFASIVSIEGDEMKLNNQYYSVQNEKLNISWNKVTGAEEIDITQPLFSVKLMVNADAVLSNILSFDRNINAEVYDEELVTEGLNLKVRNGLEDVFRIYQNTPNPFTNETEIGFLLPKAGDVTITIYDITGKVLYEKSNGFVKGYNSVSVSRDDLNFASGVLYYKVENGANTAVKKMIMMAK